MADAVRRQTPRSTGAMLLRFGGPALFLQSSEDLASGGLRVAIVATGLDPVANNEALLDALRPALATIAAMSGLGLALDPWSSDVGRVPAPSLAKPMRVSGEGQSLATARQ